MTACHVFIDEISRVRSLQNMDAQSWAQKSESGEEEFMESLRKGMAVLAAFSDESSYTRVLSHGGLCPQADDILFQVIS